MGMTWWPPIPDRARSPSRNGPESARPSPGDASRSSSAKGGFARLPARGPSSPSTKSSGCIPPPSISPSRVSGSPAKPATRAPTAPSSHDPDRIAGARRAGSDASATRLCSRPWTISTSSPPRPFAAGSITGHPACGSWARGSGGASRRSRSPRPPSTPGARPGSRSISPSRPRTSRSWLDDPEWASRLARLRPHPRRTGLRGSARVTAAKPPPRFLGTARTVYTERNRDPGATMILRWLAREFRDFPATSFFCLSWIVVFAAMTYVHLASGASLSPSRWLIFGFGGGRPIRRPDAQRPAPRPGLEAGDLQLRPLQPDPHRR